MLYRKVLVEWTRMAKHLPNWLNCYVPRSYAFWLSGWLRCNFWTVLTDCGKFSQCVALIKQGITSFSYEGVLGVPGGISNWNSWHADLCFYNKTHLQSLWKSQGYFYTSLSSVKLFNFSMFSGGKSAFWVWMYPLWIMHYFPPDHTCSSGMMTRANHFTHCIL